jgi:hypothetical protein
MPSLRWRRFLNNIEFQEVAMDRCAVYTRRGYTQLEAKLVKLDFADESDAKAHYDKLVARLEKRWEEDRPVVRAIPHETSKPLDKNLLSRRRSEALVPLRTEYRRRLKEAKLDYRTRFVRQVGPRATSDDVARRCVAIAEEVFGVEFARAWTNGVDEVLLEDDEYAYFYESPAKVQRIAEKRLLGKLTLADGAKTFTTRRGVEAKRRE